MCYTCGTAQELCVIVSSEERARLTAVIADRNRRRKHVDRARIIVHSADRLAVAEVARRAGVSRPAVWRWQRRFAEAGLDGLLRDKTRRPGTAPLPQAIVARVLAATCAEPPGAATHWTGRAMAKTMGISLWARCSAFGRRSASSRTARGPSGAPPTRLLPTRACPGPDRGRGHRRPLPGSAGPRRGVVDRREIADPEPAPGTNRGARPHPARPAAQTRQMRDHDPRR